MFWVAPTADATARLPGEAARHYILPSISSTYIDLFVIPIYGRQCSVLSWVIVNIVSRTL